MLSVLPSTIPRPLSGSSLPRPVGGAQPSFGLLSRNTTPSGDDLFNRSPALTSRTKPVQFGGGGKAMAFGTGGLASGILLWPLSLVVGLFGLIIHPLLPIAALMGVAPIGLSIWGAISGWKSK